MVISVDTRAMMKNGFKATEIKMIRDRCLATDNQLEESRYFIQDVEVQRICRASLSKLQALSIQGRFPIKTGHAGAKGYDVREIIKYFWEALHGTNLDTRIKKQKELMLSIQNKEKLGEYVKRSMVEERITHLLLAIKRMYMYTIKNSSPLLVGCPSARAAERVLDNQLREVFALLEKEAQQVEWLSEQKINFETEAEDDETIEEIED